MDGATVSIIAGICVAIILIMFAMSRKQINCPSCGREIPKMRTPTSMNQAMWGGYTCQGCGAELDAGGKLKAKT